MLVSQDCVALLNDLNSELKILMSDEESKSFTEKLICI